MQTSSLYRSELLWVVKAINLAPDYIKTQRKLERFYPWITFVTLSLFIIMIAYFGVGLYGIRLGNAELSTLKVQHATVSAEAASLISYEEEKRAIDKRQKIVDTATHNRLDPYVTAGAVTKYLPRGIWVENFSVETRRGISISGVVEDTGHNSFDKDWNKVASTVDDLTKVPLFRNIWLEKGTLDDEYAKYEQSDLPSSSHNSPYPNVVDRFSITGDTQLSLSPKGKPVWSDKSVKHE